MPLSHVIRKDTPISEDSESRDVQIVHKASLVRIIFTRDSKEVLDKLKETTLGNDDETSIKGLKRERKSIQ